MVFIVIIFIASLGIGILITQSIAQPLKQLTAYTDKCYRNSSNDFPYFGLRESEPRAIQSIIPLPHKRSVINGCEWGVVICARLSPQFDESPPA